MSRRRRVGIQITIDVLLYAALSAICLVLYKGVPPVRSGFYCNDPSIRKPYIGDTVTLSHLICGYAFILITIFVIEVLQSRAHTPELRKYLVHALRSSLLLICLLQHGLAVCMLLTQVGKLSVGKLRPHFMVTCQPDISTDHCSIGYIEDYNCTNSNVSREQVMDAYKSFPSGHASYGACVAVFMMVVFHHRVTTTITIMLKFFLQVTVACLALFVGLSRVRDNRHHMEDVMAGFIIGAGVTGWLLWSYGERVFRSIRAASEDHSDIDVELDAECKMAHNGSQIASFK